MVALLFHCWNLLWCNNSCHLMSRHMLNVIYGVYWVCLAEVWEKEFDPIMVILRTVYRRDVQSAMDRYSALWVTSCLPVSINAFLIIISWWLLFEPLLPGCVGEFCSIKINHLLSVISASSVKMWGWGYSLSAFFFFYPWKDVHVRVSAWCRCLQLESGQAQSIAQV